MDHGIREIFAHLGNLVLAENDTDLVNDTDYDQYHDQYGSQQQQGHVPEDYLIGIGNDTLKKKCFTCICRNFRCPDQTGILQGYPFGFLYNISGRIQHAGHYIGMDPDGIQQYGVDGIQIMKIDAFPAQGIYPLLEKPLCLRFQQTAQFPLINSGTGHSRRIRGIGFTRHRVIIPFHAETQVHAHCSILQSPLLPPLIGTMKNLQQGRIPEQVIALGLHAVARKLISIGQPDILQFYNRYQTHHSNPPDMFRFHLIRVLPSCPSANSSPKVRFPY